MSLPFEIWLKIAEYDPQCWCLLTRSIKCLGLYSLDVMVQNNMRIHFTKEVVKETNNLFEITSILPNGTRHGLCLTIYNETMMRSGYYVLGQKHGMFRFIDGLDSSDEFLYSHDKIIVHGSDKANIGDRADKSGYPTFYPMSDYCNEHIRFTSPLRNDEGIRVRSHQSYYLNGKRRQYIYYNNYDYSGETLYQIENYNEKEKCHGVQKFIYSSNPFEKYHVRNYYRGLLHGEVMCQEGNTRFVLGFPIKLWVFSLIMLISSIIGTIICCKISDYFILT